MSFNEMSNRSKRREAVIMSSSKEITADLLINTARMSTRKKTEKDLAVILKETVQSPTRP